MNQLRHLAASLRASFWFLPALLVAASGGLAAGMIALQTPAIDAWAAQWPRLFGAGAAGARVMLSTIASSMMTVVGVSFSMTLVTLALASSQYTSRILRNFMSDRLTQFALGAFTGIFTYCLVVLRTIRGGDEGDFVPHLAVFVGVALAVFGVAVLIMFIHHIAVSIQASSIIASVATETFEVVDHLFPERLADAAEADAEPVLETTGWREVPAQRDGYLQRVDDTALLRLTVKLGAVVRMEHPIGAFVVKGETLLWVRRDPPLSPGSAAELAATYRISRHRTLEQDAGFGIRQLVDMALRALSPGVNDTTTAVICVDHLTAILSRLAERRFPSPRREREGTVRVIARTQTFEWFVDQAFDQIRAAAAGNAAMLSRLVAALQRLAPHCRSTQRRAVLRRHLDCLAEVGQSSLQATFERKRFDDQLAQGRGALG